MGRPNPLYDGEFWIQDRYENSVIDIPGCGRWQVDEKLSEKACTGYENSRPGSSEFVAAEATAVYNCHRVGGESTSEHAIVKLHLQIPDLDLHEEPSEDPAVRAKQASLSQHIHAKDELFCLGEITKREFKHGPRLFGSSLVQQDAAGWVPGGYALFLLMERLPGYNLERWLEMHNHSDEVCAEVRPVLKAAMIQFGDLGFYYPDARPSNAMWDPVAKRCFIIDYEAAAYCGEHKVSSWDDDDFYDWGIAESWTESFP